MACKFAKIPGLLAGAMFVCLVAADLSAQVQPVQLRVDPDAVGLGGFVRPGTWTPLRLTLSNQTSQPIVVRCQWILRDIDGDLVVAERVAPLTPGIEQWVWLYAVPDVNLRRGATWTVQVLEAESGDMLAFQRLDPADTNLLRPPVGVIGVTSAAWLGLQAYSEQWTQHEQITYLRGLDPQKLQTLPDRWQGLALLDALIWTSDGGDPASLSPEAQEAIREWVRRGGHLVVSMRPVGDPWFASPLADMLPRVDAHAAYDVELPAWLYRARPVEASNIDMTVFAEPGARASVLLRDEHSRPVVVAHRYGFGRVTLLGVNLTDPRLIAHSMPNGSRFWNTVFAWRSPAYTRQFIDGQVREGEMTRIEARRPTELGVFIEKQIAMQKTATGALLGAIVMFGVYWLVAGPLSFGALKRRRRVHHSWMVFTAVVLVFSVAAWGGALLMRPSTMGIQHFSVLDVRADSHDVHVHSWMSLYVPKHGRCEVIIAPDIEGPNSNTVSSAGLLGSADQGSFLDPQRYSVDAASPTRRVTQPGASGGLLLPVRSTSKQLEVDYLGDLDANHRWLTHTWGLPTGEISVVNGFPVGQLRHNLPGELTDVLFVYCPGDGQEPLVFFHRDSQKRIWPAGADMMLPTSADGKLLVMTRPLNRERRWNSEGFLGQRIGEETGLRAADLGPDVVVLASNEIVQAIELLSFYGTLPPPDFLPAGTFAMRPYYTRALGRQLDLSSLIAMKQLIVIGHMDKSPLPVPMSVDGSTVPAEGWTVVRFIYPLQ